MQEYSCQSDSHGTLSRIDLCLVSSDMLNMVAGIKYLPRTLSIVQPFIFDSGSCPGHTLFISGVKTELIVVGRPCYGRPEYG